MAGFRETLRGLAGNQVVHRQFRRITLMALEGVAMPVKTKGAARGGRPAGRASGRGRARAPAAEQLSRADREARGKDARARRRWRRTRSSLRTRRGIRSGCCWSRKRPGCRNCCRSGTGGCWSRRSRSTGARRCRWRPTWPPPPPRGCGCSCAGTRTWPISGRSPPPRGGWSLTSTTSTRPCPARSSGTSSGWRPAWPWPGGRTGSPPRTAARSSWRGSRATARRCAPSPASRSWRCGMPTWTSRTRSPSTGRR